MELKRARERVPYRRTRSGQSDHERAMASKNRRVRGAHAAIPFRKRKKSRLKTSAGTLEWVGRFNNIRACAREMVETEITCA